MADNKPELQRGLEARHIELIALGGTIGVGLFMGAASTLKWAGPSVLLAYIIAGLFVFFIMRSMGEMLFLEPVTGSFAVYAHRYMSPFFGYLTAWSYWFMWMAVGISEITAIGVYVQFWFPEMAQWIPALIAVALVALANLAAVRLYGEIEFWFAMIKVTTIIVMIVIGLGVIFFGFGNGGQVLTITGNTGKHANTTRGFMADNKPELQRGLEARHIELIALGGTIGVGLFMGAASTLKWAGPSVLLAYIIAGLFVFFIMRSMGEMLFLEPVTGSFAVYAHRYMSPFFGYLTAWSYWFMWMAVGISEITAIGVYVQFWFPEMAQWIPALIAVALVALANLAAVRLYGEIEFWFAMIKVTTIIVMIVIGLGVIFFGFGNGGQSIGFSNLTEHGGFFAGGWKGFLTALCIVVASYQGVELIGITAGEAKNPQVTLRSAVGKVLWRILIFYVGAIFVIVTIFPWNEIGSNGSPFVLTFAKIGITAAAGIINFVVLTAALSGCNSGMYSCGRMLYALAKNRQLPAAMAKVSRHGVPVAGVAVSIAILLIGSCLNYIIPNPQRVFVYVYSASVLPGMVPWFVILISQLRFRRAHKAAIASHPFRSILFPWANYVTMAFLICVLIGMYFNEDTRMSLFVGIIFMLAVTAIYKVFGLNRHGKAHKLEE